MVLPDLAVLRCQANPEGLDFLVLLKVRWGQQDQLALLVLAALEIPENPGSLVDQDYQDLPESHCLPVVLGCQLVLGVLSLLVLL